MLPHRHRRFEIMYVTSGIIEIPIYEYSEKTKGICEIDVITLKRGDAIFINQSVIHGFRNTERNKPANVINIEFDFYEGSEDSFLFNAKNMIKQSQSMKIWLENYSPYTALHDGSGNLQHILIMLIDRGTQLLNIDIREEDSQSTCLFWSMLLFLSDYIAKNLEKPHQTSYAQAIEVYLAKNYSEPISIQGIAHHFHLNPSYIQRIFKKATGMSIVTYVNNLRIKKAAQMMMSGMPLIEIAISCGINSRQHFWKLFQKYYGCSPNEYRQNCYINPEMYIHYEIETPNSYIDSFTKKNTSDV